MNAKNFAASHVAAGCLIVAIVAVVCAPTKVLADSGNNNLLLVGQQDAGAANGKVKLTPSLVAWISHQSEGIVEEMEAIAKFNAETTSFSVVSYLRYLTLFNHLKVVAGKRPDEFKWIARKAKMFARTYDSAMQIVFNYLQDVDRALSQIEYKEPKSKQVDPSNDWTKNYEIIRYIALRAPVNTELANVAKEMLAASPNGTLDKARSIRYSLKTRAFSR